MDNAISTKKGSKHEIEITATAFKGKGVGKIGDLAVFVPQTAPGDVVKVMITKKKKKYREAKVIEVIKESDERIQPLCRHANVCGGCSWQHLPYEAQLRYKTEQVQSHMTRIGGLDIKVLDAIGCETPFYYRNKMEYSFANKRWLTEKEIKSDDFVSDQMFSAGMHAPGRFDKILHLEECHLQDPISFKILDFVRNYCLENDISAWDTFKQEGYMRHLMIRNAYHTDDLMVNVVSYEDQPELMEKLTEALLAAFPSITTITNNINDTLSPVSVGTKEVIYHGPGYIIDKIGEYEFKIHPNAFFQTNTAQAEKLYTVARDFAEIKEGDNVYDLYCGVGTLTLFVSEKAKHVLGIELNPVSIKNAEFNAETNQVSKVSYIEGDMKEAFSEEMVQKYGAPDVLITDPPRAGMHPDVVEHLNKLRVPRIVYVSCDSSTMARDLKMLSEVYEVETIQPVDMFPQTYHIETVAKLKLRN